MDLDKIASGFEAPTLIPSRFYGDLTKETFVHLIKSTELARTQGEETMMSKIYLRIPGFYECLRDLFISAELGFVPYDIDKSPF